jgi:hypothetical protein
VTSTRRPSSNRSRRIPVAAVVAAVVLVALFGVGVKWAVDNTLTRHSEVDPDSSLVVTIRGERESDAEHGRDELVEAVVASCQLEVTSTADPDSIQLVDEDRGIYQVVFHPSLDTADQRQLRGCMEDLKIDHFRSWVQSMESIGA